MHGDQAADAAAAPAAMPAAVPAAAPAAATAEVAAARRCANATEEAMLEELQRAEAALYLAHQVFGKPISALLGSFPLAHANCPG